MTQNFNSTSENTWRVLKTFSTVRTLKLSPQRYVKHANFNEGNPIKNRRRGSQIALKIHIASLGDRLLRFRRHQKHPTSILPAIRV